MNWSYLFRPYIILHFSATNLTGRENIFGYRYSAVPGADGRYERIAIGPGAKRFIFLGLFITLSKDNRTNQIRNL
jgi:hypothetical protein